MPERSPHAPLESRVSALDAGLSTLTQNVDNLMHAIKDIANENRKAYQDVQAEMRDSHTRLSRDIAQQSKTNYPMMMALLSGLAIAVTILMGFGALAMGNVNANIRRVEAHQQGIETEVSSHASRQSHAGAERGIQINAQQISSHAEAIRELEAAVNRHLGEDFARGRQEP